MPSKQRLRVRHILKKMATLLQKREWAQKRRDKARANGICIVCAANPVGTNRDGTDSVRCGHCADKLAQAKARARAQRSGQPTQSRPNVNRDWDGTDGGYLEQMTFKRYCEALSDAVAKFVKKHGEYPTCRQTKDAMDEKLNDRWHQCALDALPKVNEIWPYRYAPLGWVRPEKKLETRPKKDNGLPRLLTVDL